MRELKMFRAWDMDAKSYVEEPILVDNFGQVYVVCEESSDKRGTCLITHKPNVILERDTGLKDKNGKEICEGDIVRYTIWLWGAAKKLSCTTVVDWWSGEEENYPYCTTSGFSLPYGEDGYEVIGNIHENGDILNDEQN